MEHELNNPLSENTIRTNLFTHDDELYDLDIVRKEVRNLPRVLINVDRLKWLLDECEWSIEDAKRYAYLGRPVFVVNWQDKIVVVDGYHRLHRAVRLGLQRLPAIYIPDWVMDKAKIKGLH